MSATVEFQSLTQPQRLRITNECEVREKGRRVGGRTVSKPAIECYHVEEDLSDVYLPFAFYVRMYKRFPDVECDESSFELREGFGLREEQEGIFADSMAVIEKTRSVVVAVHVGFGKSFLGVEFARVLGVKTLIFSHRVAIINHWVSEIQKFSTAKVQVVKGKKEFDPDADIYIMNPIIVSKRSRESYKHIGLLIVDEVHLIPAEKMSRSLMYVCPRYCVGLSATPNRRDGLDSILDLYFGKERVERKLNRPFDVKVFRTEFEPVEEYTKQGTLDWNKVMNSLAENKKRNRFICRVALKYKDYNILILCKRVQQCEYLTDRLRKKGESVAQYSGSQESFDKEARVLVSTFSKAGLGFDHPKLTMLILASDVDTQRDNVIEQYVGRVFRKRGTRPLVVDIVDKYSVLERHYGRRRKWYKSHGGEVVEIG